MTKTKEWKAARSPFGVYPHQAQFLPAPLHNILNAQVELAAHYDCVGFASELVEEVERDGVDLVVDVKTTYVACQPPC